MSNLDYLKNISGLANINTSKKTEDLDLSNEPKRRDIFEIKCITDKGKRKVILNENKLKTAYK